MRKSSFPSCFLSSHKSLYNQLSRRGRLGRLCMHFGVLISRQSTFRIGANFIAGKVGRVEKKESAKSTSCVVRRVRMRVLVVCTCMKSGEETGKERKRERKCVNDE